MPVFRAHVNPPVAGSSPRKKPPANLQPARAPEFEEVHVRLPSEMRARGIFQVPSASNLAATCHYAITSAACLDNSLSRVRAHCYEEGSSRGAFTFSAE